MKARSPSTWPVLSALLVLWLTACGAPPSVDPGAGDSPALEDAVAALAEHNLLLITIDTLRADRLGAYGYENAATPHLDALARDGVRFSRVYSSVPLTLPSHSALFTGRYPFTIQVRNNGSYFLPEAETTLAELLAERGFSTSATIASYVLSAKFGIAQGFASYDDALASDQLLRTFTSEIPADEVFRRFKRRLDQQTTGSGRFFAWVHFYDPHLPYTPPPELAERFAGDLYSGEIAHVDRQVGAILAELASRGLDDRTLIVVTSDHGEAFGEHGETGHGLLCYDESLLVPLIVHAPGIFTPRVVEERARLIDILPTLGELLDVPLPADLQGRSLAAALLGAGDKTPRDVYFESLLGQEDKNWAPLTGLIVDQYKYIALPEPELYDLSRDPGETTNVARQERSTLYRLDEALRATLLGSAEAAPQELSDEDARHLQSLGYLSPSMGKSKKQLDPKRGIVIDQALAEVRSALESGDPGGARERLAAVRAEHPDVEMPTFDFLRHEIELARGDAVAALAALDAGMAKFPESEQFPFKKAAYLIELGRHVEAEALCRQLLERNPRFSQAWILRGRSAEARKELGEAAEAYRRALEIEPQSSALRRRLAEVLVRQGELQAALELYDALIADGSLTDDATALFQVAMLHGRVGDTARAEELFRRGLAHDPAAMHQMSFALILWSNGKHDEAVAQLERTLAERGGELSADQRSMARRTLAAWRGGR